VRVDVVLICGKHMLDCIISLQRNVLGQLLNPFLNNYFEVFLRKDNKAILTNTGSD
jgi:hypothetical protein